MLSRIGVATVVITYAKYVAKNHKETSNHSGKRLSHSSEFIIFCWSLPLAFQEGLQVGLCRRYPWGEEGWVDW